MKQQRKAFTLVEVMLAVGVIAISISAMIGLLAAITNNLNLIRQQNKAVSLLSNIETTLQMKKFDTVLRWVANPSEPYIIYFWDEYQNPDDPDNSSMLTFSSEDGGKSPKMPPSTEDLEKGEGEVYRVLLSLYQGGLKGQRVRIDDDSEYSGGAVSSDAQTYALSYIPIKVEILADPRDDIINGTGDPSTNEQRLIYEDIIMKMR